MDFLQNLIKTFSNSNMDISKLMSTFTNNTSGDNNIMNILPMLTTLFSQPKPNSPTNYKEMDYDEIYATLSKTN